VTVAAGPAVRAVAGVAAREVLARGVVLARVQRALVRVVLTMGAVPGGGAAAGITEQAPTHDHATHATSTSLQ
jgi:hypothetical protein